MEPRSLMIAALALLLASCASTGNFCDIAGGPHRVTDNTLSRMSDAEVKQELSYNKKGERLCGWKP